MSKHKTTGVKDFFKRLLASLDSGAKLKLFCAALMAVAAGASTAVVPLVLSKLADGAYSQSQNASSAELAYTGMALLVASYVISISASKGIISIGMYMQSLVRIDVLKALSIIFFEQLLRKSSLFYAKNNVGYIAQRLNQIGNDVYIILRGGLFGIAAPLIQLATTSLILLASGATTVFVIFLIYSLAYLIYIHISSRTLALQRELMMNAGRESYSTLADTILNISAARNFGASKIINDRYAHVLSHDKFFQKAYWNKILVQMLVVNAFFVIAFGLCVGYTAWQAVNGQVTPGQLVLVASYVISLSSPLEALGDVFSEAKQSLASLNSFVRDSQPTLVDRSLVGVSTSFTEVAIKNLNYSYADNNSNFALSIQNLKLRRGEIVAITGESGCGKSTLVNILNGTLSDYVGEVELYGVQLNKIKPSELSQYLIALNQSVNIFQDTLRFNLQIADRSAPDENLEHAIKLAGLGEFYNELPLGLDTVMGDRGCTISGGQRQRVDIARLFLRQPKIIILDESTASLDVENENLVLNNIAKNFPDSIIILISHRETVLRHANKVLVLDDGKLVAEGSHSDLMIRSQYYHNLICTQMTSSN